MRCAVTKKSNSSEMSARLDKTGAHYHGVVVNATEPW